MHVIFTTQTFYLRQDNRFYFVFASLWQIVDWRFSYLCRWGGVSGNSANIPYGRPDVTRGKLNSILSYQNPIRKPTLSTIKFPSSHILLVLSFRPICVLPNRQFPSNFHQQIDVHSLCSKCGIAWKVIRNLFYHLKTHVTHVSTVNNYSFCIYVFISIF